MQDLEMVIEGLTALGTILEPLLLKVNHEGRGKEDVLELKSHLGLAVEALQRQIPMTVMTTYHVHQQYIDGKYGECPRCKHTGLKKHSHEHCWWCGQKLDWS